VSVCICQQCSHIAERLKRGLCQKCYDRQRRQAKPAERPVPLITTLPSPDEIDAMWARGVNRQVLYQSATAIVESVMDPDTGLEVNRLTCVGDTWPEPPLAAVLRAERRPDA